MPDETNIIVDPHDRDWQDAGDILEAVCQLLAKHDLLMKQTPKGFVLAQITGSTAGGVLQSRALAVVSEISVRAIEWKACGPALDTELSRALARWNERVERKQ